MHDTCVKIKKNLPNRFHHIKPRVYTKSCAGFTTHCDIGALSQAIQHFSFDISWYADELSFDKTAEVRLLLDLAPCMWSGTIFSADCKTADFPIFRCLFVLPIVKKKKKKNPWRCRGNCFVMLKMFSLCFMPSKSSHLCLRYESCYASFYLHTLHAVAACYSQTYYQEWIQVLWGPEAYTILGVFFKKNNTKLLLKISYVSECLFRATLRNLARASEETKKLKLC